MKRVLFVSTSTTLGGAEKTLYTLATLLNPRKCEVAGIVSLKPSGLYAEKLASAGFPAFSLGLQGLPSFSDLKRLSQIIRETKPDIVHAVMYQAIQMCRLVKRASSTDFKLVSSPRVNYRTRSYPTRLLDLLLKGTDDLLIAESKSSRDYLLHSMGYRPAKVKTIYNGVDAAAWAASPVERRQRRLELRLGEDELLIGTAGRLDKQKGQSVLLDALALLKEKAPRCVVLGEGPERPKLEAKIKRLGLEDRVTLEGAQKDLPSWFSALDLFVLPSLWEGLPNSILEAMAAGLPVIASGVDGVAEIVEDGKNGLLAAPKDAAGLAAKIAGLVGDPAARARLGAAGKEAVVKKFSLITMMSSYEEAYAEIP